MSTIPLPWVISMFMTVAIVATVRHTRLPRNARIFFTMGLGSIAGASVLLGLRIEYDLAFVPYVQPHVSLLGPPAIYLGFLTLTRQSGRIEQRILMWHGAGFVVAECALLLRYYYLTDFILTVFALVYVWLFVGLLRGAPDRFVQIPPNGHPQVRLLVGAMTLFLVSSVLVDLSVMVTAAFLGEGSVVRLLSGMSGLYVMFVFGLVLAAVSLLVRAPRSDPKPAPEKAPSSGEEHAKVLADISTLLNDTALYRDAALTLARLARRSGYPTRAISNAVNVATDENFSRFINGFRIRYAMHLLEKSDLPVTEIMLDSGFVSKSSFNSEFRRITGQTPTAYRKSSE